MKKIIFIFLISQIYFTNTGFCIIDFFQEEMSSDNTLIPSTTITTFTTTIVPSDCDYYEWTIFHDGGVADSCWVVCPEDITFELICNYFTFIFCYENFYIEQYDNYIWFTKYDDQSENEARIEYDCGGDCCLLFDEDDIKGRMWSFPPYFDMSKHFRIYYGNDYININGLNISTTTTILSPCALEEIYGENSKEAELLRYLRDETLSQSAEGMEIIRLYYKWNPVISELIEKDPQFKEDLKEIIDELISKK